MSWSYWLFCLAFVASYYILPILMLTLYANIRGGILMFLSVSIAFCMSFLVVFYRRHMTRRRFLYIGVLSLLVLSFMDVFEFLFSPFDRQKKMQEYILYMLVFQVGGVCASMLLCRLRSE